MVGSVFDQITKVNQLDIYVDFFELCLPGLVKKDGDVMLKSLNETEKSNENLETYLPHLREQTIALLHEFQTMMNTLRSKLNNSKDLLIEICGSENQEIQNIFWDLMTTNVVQSVKNMNNLERGDFLNDVVTGTNWDADSSILDYKGGDLPLHMGQYVKNLGVFNKGKSDRKNFEVKQLPLGIFLTPNSIGEGAFVELVMNPLLDYFPARGSQLTTINHQHVENLKFPEIQKILKNVETPINLQFTKNNTLSNSILNIMSDLVENDVNKMMDKHLLKKRLSFTLHRMSLRDMNQLLYKSQNAKNSNIEALESCVKHLSKNELTSIVLEMFHLSIQFSYKSDLYAKLIKSLVFKLNWLGQVDPLTKQFLISIDWEFIPAKMGLDKHFEFLKRYDTLDQSKFHLFMHAVSKVMHRLDIKEIPEKLFQFYIKMQGAFVQILTKIEDAQLLSDIVVSNLLEEQKLPFGRRIAWPLFTRALTKNHVVKMVEQNILEYF